MKNSRDRLDNACGSFKKKIETWVTCRSLV